MAKARRILVVRTDHLGDLLLSTPFLDALRGAFPRSEITALVTAYTRPALERNPSLDVLRDFNPRASKPDLQRQQDALAAERYDACIALSPTMPAYRLASAVQAPVRAGYIYSRRWVPRALTNLMLSHRAIFHIDRLVERRETIPHEVEQLRWFARSLGFAADSTPLRLYPHALDLDRLAAELGEACIGPDAADGLPRHSAGLLCGSTSPWLVVNLARAWVTPPWSVPAYVELLRGLLQVLGDARLLVTCGPQEEAWADEIRQAFAEEARVRLLRGRTISEWGAALVHARMALTSDTGALHMAVATRTPVVACYEQRTYHLCSQQWAPWMVAHRKVEKASPASSIPAMLQAAAELWKPGR